MNIDSILHPFQRFGVHLGLERIQQLLDHLGNPHQQTPIIHVAGTNGKGSVCAYLSSVLTEAGYQVGRYISPHLVDWTERICINQKPILPEELQQSLFKVIEAIGNVTESPTQFEVITAAAWLYFAEKKVDIAVIEVGLGGRLDATNVCDQPLASIITSISREHWQVLGSTLAEIASEKAGILKAGCPAIIGQLPPEAQAVVEKRIQELGCPAIWPQPAKDLGKGWVEYQGSDKFNLKSIQYPLPLLGEFQLMNSSLAITTLQLLQQQGWKISETAMQNGMKNTQWPGRIQWETWQNKKILIDGAHNPAAAIGLRQYVDSLPSSGAINLSKFSINWVMGSLSTKDHSDIFKALLKPGDSLYLVPVPDHSSADPKQLADLAQTICPELAFCQTYPNLFDALNVAVINENLTVFCGSLYLIGYFFQQQQTANG